MTPREKILRDALNHLAREPKTYEEEMSQDKFVYRFAKNAIKEADAVDDGPRDDDNETKEKLRGIEKILRDEMKRADILVRNVNDGEEVGMALEAAEVLKNAINEYIEVKDGLLKRHRNSGKDRDRLYDIIQMEPDEIPLQDIDWMASELKKRMEME